MNNQKKLKSLDRSLSKLLEREISEGQLPGACISISHRNQELYRKNFGYADIEGRKLIDNNTIFRLYSMSKPIAAVAFMILFERGEIDLFAPVSNYLPYFKEMKVLTDNGIVPVKRQILIIDLLRMTSGIVYPDPDPAGQCMQKLFSELQSDISKGKQKSTQQMCRLLAEQPLAFHPGEQWRYGLNTDVLGVVIEVVSGSTLGEFYKAEIFEPLGMIDTGFYVPRKNHHRFAELYSYNEVEGKSKLIAQKERHLCLTKCLEPPLFESAGAGLVSTLDDYRKLTSILSCRGSYNNISVLSKKTMEVLLSNQLDEKTKNSIYFENLRGYGYGNFMRILMDPAASGTSGSLGEVGWDGWCGTYFLADPIEEFSLVFFTQRCGYQNPELIRKLRNIAYSVL